MYISKIAIQNYGPLVNFNLEMPFNKEDGEWGKTPQPLIIVGPNGTGKTIILSHIINSFLTAKTQIYDDCEIPKGKVFKVRSPFYINDTPHHYYHYSRINFDNGEYTVEFQLNDIKKDIISRDPNFIPPNSDWDLLKEDASDLIRSSFWSNSKAHEILDNNVIKYFPADRTDKPAWENNDTTSEKDDFQRLSEYSNISNRQIIATNEFGLNRKWLLDIIFDSNTLPKKNGNPPVPKVIYDLLDKVINAIFCSSNDIPVRFAISDRHHRKLELVRKDNDAIVLPNISQLSLGQSLLLNLFLSIIRDADNSKKNLNEVSDINGIVLIDEIENHLHNDLIVKVLPQLIKLFPKIQFVITSHSPMFLLGMQSTFNDKFKIIELNSATENGYEEKTAEQFSEFKKAFELYENTNTFYDQLKGYKRPILITEGKTDETLIRCAWNALYASEEFPFDFMGFPSEQPTRGAKDLNLLLQKIGTINGKKIIGLFDSDHAGSNQFKGLTGSFSLWEQDQDIKIKQDSIFATCLPVPPSKSYMKDKPDGSGFEIEDYFPDSMLRAMGKFSEKCNYREDQNGNQIPDQNQPTYLKFKGDKAAFAEQVKTFNNHDGRFDNFKLLFDRLRKIISP